MKRFTIITVCYNAEHTIEKTIKSVMHQNYRNWEYIIIDGNSTDKTMKVINDCKKKNTIVISEDDSELYDAMNLKFNNFKIFQTSNEVLK